MSVCMICALCSLRFTSNRESIKAVILFQIFFFFKQVTSCSSYYYLLSYSVFKQVDICTYTRHTHICKVNICRPCSGVQENKQTKTEHNPAPHPHPPPPPPPKKKKKVRAKIYKQSYRHIFTTTTTPPPTPTPPPPPQKKKEEKKRTTTVVMTTYICHESRVTNLLIGVTVRPFSSGDVAQWGHI